MGDKKVRNGKMRFILPIELGEVDIFNDINESQFLKYFDQRIQSEFILNFLLLNLLKTNHLKSPKQIGSTNLNKASLLERAFEISSFSSF